MWADLRTVFAFLSASPDCRAIILSGAGKGFTAGLDLHDHVDLFAPQPGSDSARQAFAKLPLISSYQDSISSLERARVPVIAAIHGPCVGGGVDLICAADIRSVSACALCIRPLTCPLTPLCARLASSDAWFSIMETRLGLAADVGTLQVRTQTVAVFLLMLLREHNRLRLTTPSSQRLPRIIGNSSLAREWAFTSRRFTAAEVSGSSYLVFVSLSPTAVSLKTGSSSRPR
jgi:enoyl-CoA hydratase/carnithine racemase